MIERFRVAPGAVIALTVTGGDRFDVIDRHGRQPVEMTVLAADPCAVRGSAPDSPATVLRNLMAGPDENGYAAGRILALLSRHVDQDEARATRLFDAESAAGSRLGFTVDGDAVVLIAAPAEPMDLSDTEPTPPSEVMVEVHRARPIPVGQRELPAPLAEPLWEIRIDASTASSYEIGAGQFVQILDVQGRQCSDFLAFDARGLDVGREYGLDATTTRTIGGGAYPQPGLFGKFFDGRAQPLVEVVRDTVGRHDTFALACTAKYYADFGYPGHVNCTDNFNAALSRFGVSPRAGWPALNLFYNTAFDAAYQLTSDEPWSRPGDYVMLRACTDLVCASSACPDDIDPANGWTPTDIHIRVYDSTRRFSVAVGHRLTPDSEPVLTKPTAFTARTSALTSNFVEYQGYWLPASFDGHGPHREYWACRERVAVMDLSALRKFEVLGPDAEALLQATLSRDIRRLSRGQVVYSAMCTESGGVIDDCTVLRLSDTNFRFIGGDPHDGIWLRTQAERLGLQQVWIKDSTDEMHNIAVQGPASRDLLTGLIWSPPTQPDVGDLGWFRFLIGRLGGPDGVALVVSRTGYSGELGYELWVHPRDAETLWDAVWQAGRPHGLTPLGLEALEMLRVEAGLVAAGHEFDDQIDPFEAGIGFAVPLKSKSDDFVGRAALVERKAHPQRTLVGLRLDGNETAVHGDCVHIGRAQVGVITSGVRSPILGASIALCRMAIQHSAPGTRVEVGKLDGHRKRIGATVTTFPFYDPDKTRPRS
ncbi:aminomethyltransferase family protein [Mycobacterium sp. MBM]|nr:aminomethyltransferase family protein [Mycobacterium sp. MBM]